MLLGRDRKLGKEVWRYSRGKKWQGFGMGRGGGEDKKLRVHHLANSKTTKRVE